MSNTPKLRFPEFSGEWEEKKLEGCVNILDSQRKPIESKERANRQGIYPYYGASGIIDFIDDYLFEGESVLLGEDGANIINRNSRLAFLATGKYWVNNHAHIMRANADNINYFICEYLENLDYSKICAGSAQPKLTQDVIRNLVIKKPCKNEQQKIADFLSNVDSIITAETKILNVLQKKKKALMQKLFTQQLRFKSDDGTDFPAWEEKKVIDFAKVDTGANNTQDKVEDGLYPFYVRSPIVYRSNNYIFDFPEAVLTVGDGVGTGKVFHYVQGKFDCHQRVYVIHDFENVLGKYFYFYFSEKFYARVKPMSAKNSVDSVRREMITDMKIPVPYKEEQQKIVDCLSSMDTLIKTQQKIVTTWQQRKKALLQQMFV